MLPPGLHTTLALALTERGYATPTPVQLAVIEPEANGRDLLVSAKTGSGKTVAYGLALAATLLGDAEQLPPAGAPMALVIAPTRELALQVQRELEWLYAGALAKVVSCVGGMDPRREQRLLAQGAHIVVGTPGRLRDHLERGNLSAAELRAVVLDEADEMLDLGFREELEEILDAAPAERRTLMFSATLPKPIAALANRYQRAALRIVATAGGEAHGDIEYRAVRIAPSDIEHATVNLLRYFEAGAALVFCSTRDAVRRLHAKLVERGFEVVALSGELTQNERTHALQALRDRRARVCVATDVAARGIDIPDLELVIHADLPNDPEILQHRSGRTGRAGRKGICAILAPHPKRRRVEMMLRAAHVEAIWMAPPTAEEIRARDQQRLMEQITPNAEANEEDAATARALLAEHSAEDVAAALVRLNRARLPAPEDLVDSEPEVRRDAAATGSVSGSGAAPRQGFEDSVWFRIDIGRSKNAEPRWLLPMICRRGHLTKGDIGAIRVFDRETRFEITRAAVPKFAAALRKAEDDGVRIEMIENAAAEPAHRPRGPARSYGERLPYAAKADTTGAEAQHVGSRSQAPPSRSRPSNDAAMRPPTRNRKAGAVGDALPNGGKPRSSKPYRAKPNGKPRAGD